VVNPDAIAGFVNLIFAFPQQDEKINSTLPGVFEGVGVLVGVLVGLIVLVIVGVLVLVLVIVFVGVFVGVIVNVGVGVGVIPKHTLQLLKEVPADSTS
jgi:hypothetical protein